MFPFLAFFTCIERKELTLYNNTAVDLSEAEVSKSVLLFVCGKAFPHGVLQPLPKRPALEKSNGASSLFNPSVLHYQQALANAQLQQPAFFPTGKIFHFMHMAHSCRQMHG